MKRILITGENSYIGTALEKWLLNDKTEYLIDKISLRGKEWKTITFSIYDVVVHTVGIVHIKESNKNKNLYYSINRDLAYETAKKAKSEGVKQFIYLSSMSVYGIETGEINKNTSLKPNNNYGRSKLEGESLINKLNDSCFKVTIIRPPMVYGRNCTGNYAKLSRFARLIPVFPEVKNKRSMIYIDNLSEFIKLLIDEHLSGVFFPQNKEYVNTSRMVELIARSNNKSIKLSKFLSFFLRLLNSKLVNKIFGNLIYHKELLETNKRCKMINFEDTIKLTELGIE